MSQILALLEQHNKLRTNAINLIVSENILSPRALSALNSDIQARYHIEFYAGTNYALEIIATTTNLAKNVFKAKYANIAPLSGNMCLLAVTLALTNRTDTVARTPPLMIGGGYPFKYEAFDRRPLDIPFSRSKWQINTDKAITTIEEEKPPLVILGASMISYPVPVREISEVVHQYGGIVGYDGSHTLGLIAGGQYQDPLNEGADLLFGSTHKTFPGPQGGIIVTNNENIHKKVESFLNYKPMDGIVIIDSPHLARIASLGIVLEETPWANYACQVVENAQTMARIFHDMGISLRNRKNKDYSEFTYCHQVIADFPEKDGFELRNCLAQNRIITDGFTRFGTAEITRLGFKKKECSQLSRIIAQLIRKDVFKQNQIEEEISTLIDSHRSVVL